MFERASQARNENVASRHRGRDLVDKPFLEVPIARRRVRPPACPFRVDEHTR